jgi:hypothetical protein
MFHQPELFSSEATVVCNRINSPKSKTHIHSSLMCYVQRTINKCAWVCHSFKYKKPLLQIVALDAWVLIKAGHQKR